MRRQIPAKRVGIQTVEILRRVVDRPRRKQLQHDREIAELEVEVDHRDLLASPLRQQDGKVRGDKALAAPALRAEDGDDLVL